MEKFYPISHLVELERALNELVTSYIENAPYDRAKDLSNKDIQALSDATTMLTLTREIIYIRNTLERNEIK